MKITRLSTESPYVFKWPDAEESYDECTRYRVDEGLHGQPDGEVFLAIGGRKAFGRERRRILVFRNQGAVLVEWVGVDDWDETHGVIWGMTQAGSRRAVHSPGEVPAEFREYRIAPGTNWVTGPYARRGLAIYLADGDYENLIRVGLIREAHKPKPGARMATKREQSSATPKTSTELMPDTPPDLDSEAICAALLDFGDTVDDRDLFPTVVPEARPLVFEDPFAFALATSLDRGTLADIIWTIPYDLKNALGHLDPKRLALMSEAELGAVIADLPRKPRYTDAAPRTIRELSRLVMNRFGGDAEAIWRGRRASEIKATFESIHGVGPGIASMAVLLLEKGFGLHFDDLDHSTMDIKPDVHTVRVLYRLGVAKGESERAAIEAARRLNRAYPGAIDKALWKLGRDFCHASRPDCGRCPMVRLCARKGVP